MPEMGITLSAIDFGAHHPVGQILFGGDRLGTHAVPEAGQPVPESNLVSELKSGAPQQTQWYIPVALLFQ